MMIRNARTEDLDRILDIYAIARAFMIATGNPNQWAGSYPTREDIEKDILNGTGFVLEDGGIVRAFFAFIIGPEHDYEYGTLVEGDGWLNREPYGTIHRVASDGSTRGVLHHVVSFCKERNANLRIDTHQDNKVMQHCIKKEGFIPCGLLLRPDGQYRLAYQQLFQ